MGCILRCSSAVVWVAEVAASPLHARTMRTMRTHTTQNKPPSQGTAFPLSERERLGIRGLLPPRILSLEMQEKRFMDDYEHGVELIPPEQVVRGGVTGDMARRWKLLQALQVRQPVFLLRMQLMATACYSLAPRSDARHALLTALCSLRPRPLVFPLFPPFTLLFLLAPSTYSSSSFSAAAAAVRHKRRRHCRPPRNGRETQ